MMGGQNCHADITFADGVVWIGRFRLSGPIAPPPSVRDYILQSEAATMKFLALHTKVPSPRVYDCMVESDPANAVGIGYIMMEKLPGTSLNWQAATAPQNRKVLEQFTDIMLEIEKHPFDQLGSLIDRNTLSGSDARGTTLAESSFQISSLAEHSTFRCGKNGGPIGPFTSSKEAMRTKLEVYLELILAGEIGTADNAVDVFLAHRFRLDVLDQAFPSNKNRKTGRERFYLKHADDKGDHILVNADFDIVGIIDWEWCSTASKEEAFSTPCMMWPVAKFYDGSNELAEEEVLLAEIYRDKGRDDLAEYVLKGRKIQRLFFALGPVGAAHADKKTFASLFVGMKRAFAKGADRKETVLGKNEEEWEAWKTRALEEWQDDNMLKAMLAAAQST